MKVAFVVILLALVANISLTEGFGSQFRRLVQRKLKGLRGFACNKLWNCRRPRPTHHPWTPRPTWPTRHPWTTQPRWPTRHPWTTRHPGTVRPPVGNDCLTQGDLRDLVLKWLPLKFWPNTIDQRGKLSLVSPSSKCHSGYAIGAEIKPGDCLPNPNVFPLGNGTVLDAFDKKWDGELFYGTYYFKPLVPRMLSYDAGRLYNSGFYPNGTKVFLAPPQGRWAPRRFRRSRRNKRSEQDPVVPCNEPNYRYSCGCQSHRTCIVIEHDNKHTDFGCNGGPGWKYGNWEQTACDSPPAGSAGGEILCIKLD